MVPTIGEQSFPSGGKPGNSAESASREVNGTRDVVRGSAISVALGVIVAALLAITKVASVESIAAIGTATTSGGYLVTQITEWLSQIRTSRRDAKRHEWTQRIEIVEWLHRLIALTATDTEFWIQYRGRQEIWSTDLDRFATNIAKFHDIELTITLSGLISHLASAHSFPIEPTDNKGFLDRLIMHASRAIQAAEGMKRGNVKELTARSNSSDEGEPTP